MLLRMCASRAGSSGISRRVAELLARRRHRAVDRVEESKRIVIGVAFFDETAPPRLAIGEPCRERQ